MSITNKGIIAKYIWSKTETSKQEIHKDLVFSMPTVLQNVNELLSNGLLKESGEYKSSGGRKAKVISINGEFRYSAGIDITRNHISCVIIDFSGKIVMHERIRKRYEGGIDYYNEISQFFEEFIDRTGINRKKLLGVGISLPGILDTSQNILIISHILDERNLNLDFIARCFSYPVQFENDANSGLLSELKGDLKNAVYLSLSNTVGGAYCVDGHLYTGDNSRAGEIGHMIIERNGAKCYCGKDGCFDAYCAAHVLSDHTHENLEEFFEKVEEKDKEFVKIWDEYLDNLAIQITNLRMSFDCDIILGGYVGAYIDQYLLQLAEKTRKYNNFDQNITYIKTCSNVIEASALGAAMCFIKDFLDDL